MLAPSREFSRNKEKWKFIKNSNYLKKSLQRLKNLETESGIEQSDGVDGDLFNLTMVYWQC